MRYCRPLGSYHGVVSLDKVPAIRLSPVVNKEAEKYEDKCLLLSNIIKDKRNKNVVGEDGEEDHVEMVAVDGELEEAQVDNKNSASSIDLTERGLNYLTRMCGRDARNQPCKRYSVDAILKFNDLLRRAGPNQSSTTKRDQLKLHE